MVCSNISYLTSDDGDIIVLMEKNIVGLTAMDFMKEANRFNRSDKKMFIQAVEIKIRNLLADFGIIIADDKESALKSALDTLKTKYGKTIKIIDLYNEIDDCVLFKEKGITIICDDNVISCANQIKVVDLC